MPRNGANIYSKPAGTTAVLGTATDPVKYNSVIDDLVTDANTPRPVIAGGTGAATLTGLLATLGGQPLDAALTSISATTTAANKMLYTTAVDTYAVTDLTAAARTFLAAVDAAAQIALLDADLSQIAGLTRTRGDLIHGGAANWERLALGAAGRNLVSNGTDLVYSAAMAYTNVTASRAANTDYTNSSNRPLAVVVRVTYDAANANTGLLVGGVAYSRFSIGNGFTNLVFTHSVIVPPGAVYQLSKTAPAITIDSWNEAQI